MTLNEFPLAADAGDEVETVLTFTSEVAVTAVVEFPEALLLPAAGSLTCSWSTDTDADTENWWDEGFVQVTDQVAGLAGAVAVTDVDSDVSCAVCGLAEAVEQSGGSASVRVVSALTGP